MTPKEVEEFLIECCEKALAQGFKLVPRGSMKGHNCKCPLECIPGVRVYDSNLSVKVNTDILTQQSSQILQISEFDTFSILSGFDNGKVLGGTYFTLGYNLNKMFVEKDAI